MLNGLISFIKMNKFNNENELIEKLAEKALCNVQELLKILCFEDIMNNFDIFKDYWYRS